MPVAAEPVPVGWKLPLALAFFLLADVLVPLLVGSICDPDGECADDDDDATVLVFFPKMPYYFGASAYDLMGAGLLRALLFGVLVVLRVFRRGRPSEWRQPFLQPLNAELALDPRTNGWVLAEGALEAVDPPVPWASFSAAGWIAFAATALSWTHASCKGVGRMISSGSGQGDGLDLLPLVTSPPETPFWLCVGAAYICSEAERRLFAIISARLAAAEPQKKPKESAAPVGSSTRATSGGATSGSSGGGAGGAKEPTAAELAAERSAKMKKDYVESTEPQETQTVRLLLPPSAARAQHVQTVCLLLPPSAARAQHVLSLLPSVMLSLPLSPPCESSCCPHAEQSSL